MRKKVNLIAKKEDNLSILDSIIKSRNIENVEEFLNPLNCSLTSPFIFSDMDKAVNIIKNAIQNKEKILIWGDFDADGVTSSAILYKTLSALGADFMYYIPDRITDGHGINTKVLLKLKAKNKIKVLITVDCGISNNKEIELIKTMGVKTIITDHHEPPKILPSSDCIINPLAEGAIKIDTDIKDIKKISYLSGAGVAMKLSYALLDGENFDGLKKEIMLISSIGTISDVVPLLEENRTIAALGLKYINEKRNLGVKKLFEKLNIEKEITSEDIAFILTPRINAAGRLDNPENSLKLLIEENENNLDIIIEKLDNLNKIRQSLSDKTYIEAINMINSPKECVALYNENWQTGIIGIVASKLVEKFNLPVFLMTKDDNNILRCSIRGTKQYNISNILNELKDNFTGFGGHSMAGGFSADLDKIGPDKLIEKIHTVIKENKDNSVEDFEIDVDMELSGNDITLDLINDIKKLEPCGAQNEQPKFILTNAKLISKKTIGKDSNHLSYTIQKDDKRFNCLWWKHSITSIKEGEMTDIIFRPEINFFNNEEKIQLITESILDDISEQTADNTIKLYDHRQKEGILDKINSYVEEKNGEVKIYATTINTKKEFEKFIGLKNNILNSYTNVKSLMLFDYPTDIDSFRELIRNTKPKMLHIMKNNFSKNPDDYISLICGMIKYASNNKQGEIDIKTLAKFSGLDDICVNIILELLEKIESIQIIDEGHIKYLKAPNHETIHTDSIFEIFEDEFKRINDFKEYLQKADIDSIKEITKV